MVNYPQFKKDLAKLISFKSAQSEAKDGRPFGDGAAEALSYFLSLAESFGFETKNYDNYMGEVVFGEGEEIGIIGHLDVVPEGGGWATDPYTLVEKDGYLYGRGVCDDKMPTLAALYALKELKDSKKPCRRKIRLFAGCNEESGWKDVEYFKTKGSFPEYGFSPDGNFPVSYAEKGVTQIHFLLPTLKNFTDLKGGTVVNAVCAHASAKAKTKVDEALLKKHGLSLKNDNVIESFGKAAHGSTPELGVNAMKKLFEFFLDAGEDVKDAFDFIFVRSANLSDLVNEQGRVTFSPDILKETDGKIEIIADCRIPAPFTSKDVEKRLAASGLTYYAVDYHEPLLVPKDGWFVQTLLDAYNSVTGEKGEPVSMSGSTFARVFEKGCAFGPEFDREDTNIHDANERYKISSLEKFYDILRTAIFAFAEK